MSAFDTLVSNDNPFFLSETGDQVTYQAGGNPANNKLISIIKIDEKPLLVTAATADLEHYQCEVLISNRNNTEGVTAPVILGFLGATNADKILNHLGMTWYVIDVVNDVDPSFNRVLLRSKAFPKSYLFTD